MEVLKTKIDGLFVFKPKVFIDTRGLFYESWKANKYKELGINEEFLQDNISISYKNVLRGLHFQKETHTQGQLVTPIYGRVFDACIDLRPGSTTFGEHVSFNLNHEDLFQIYMSPGIAHGFCVLSDYAILSYKCTKYYAPHSEGGIIWNDTELLIPWPISNPIISKKDLGNISFSEYRSSLSD